MIEKESGLSDLDLFYNDCSKDWVEFYELPTISPVVRRNWRLAHPEIEAGMIFWGKLSSPATGISIRVWNEEKHLMEGWASLYNIDLKAEHPYWANWGTTIPEEEK